MRSLTISIITIITAFSVSFAQKRLNCPDYYISIATGYHAEGEIQSALSNYYKQRKYYPDCPDSKYALYKSIEIYHEKIVESTQFEDINIARSMVIEFSNLSDDSTMITDVKKWWGEIQRIEKETTMTAAVFWEITGSVILLILYFTVANY